MFHMLTLNNPFWSKNQNYLFKGNIWNDFFQNEFGWNLDMVPYDVISYFWKVLTDIYLNNSNNIVISFTLWWSKDLIALREETFASRKKREILGINFREWPLLRFFTRTNFREWPFLKFFAGTNFRERW